MWNPSEAAPGGAEAAELLGEVRALAGQALTPPDLAIAPLPDDRSIARSVASLRTLTRQYATETLAREEWPLIVQAYQFTVAGHVRELIALDQSLARRVVSTATAEASFRVGRRQLNKLRGLRHERVIAKFLAAIEAGEAWGWHPIVFGIVLGTYHLPLRQGLLQFASHSLAGMVTAAEQRHRLPAAQCQAVLDEVVAALPAQMPELPGASVWKAV